MSGDDVVAETRATYERITAGYEARAAVDHPGRLELRSAFADRVPPRGSVADIGCGPGRDARHFASLGLRVLAVDASSAMLDRAAAPGVTPVLGDLRQLPVRDESLDGLWSSASLLHVPRADVPATLSGWRSAVRSGGVLGLSTALGDHDVWEDVPYLGDDPTAHERPLRRWFVHHERPALLGLLAAAGFETQQVSEHTTHRHWLQVLARAA